MFVFAACILSNEGLVAASENGHLARRRKPQPDRREADNFPGADRFALET
jgi:hypothetical protein